MSGPRSIPAPPPAPDLDPDRADAEQAARILARGVRRTLALKAHLARKRREAAAEARARGEARSRRRQQVQQLVAYFMAADGDMDAADVEFTSIHILERLLDDPEIDAALALAEHPIEEIVIRLCREMDIRAELVLPGFGPSGPYKTVDELWGPGEPKPRGALYPNLSSGWDAASKRPPPGTAGPVRTPMAAEHRPSPAPSRQSENAVASPRRSTRYPVAPASGSPLLASGDVARLAAAALSASCRSPGRAGALGPSIGRD